MADLRELEKIALQAQMSGRWQDAINAWLTLLEIEPRWELGYAHYHLADCYLRIGQVDQSELAYRKALEFDPQDSMFTDALESFLNARRAGYI